MTDPRIAVLETQLEDVAARVAQAEDELQLLRKALCRPHVLELLQLSKVDVEPYMTRLTANAERSRIRLERRDALETARRDELLKRLDKAERLAEQDGQPFSEAWTQAGKDQSEG